MKKKTNKSKKKFDVKQSTKTSELFDKIDKAVANIVKTIKR